MRKIIVICVFVCLFLSVNLFSVPQDPQPVKNHPMASFMDAKWGTTAFDFTRNFAHKSSLKLEKNNNFYYMSDFRLGDLILKKVKFKFVSTGSQTLKLNNGTLKNFILTEVLIFMKPEEFETLLNIFKCSFIEKRNRFVNPSNITSRAFKFFGVICSKKEKRSFPYCVAYRVALTMQFCFVNLVIFEVVSKIL